MRTRKISLTIGIPAYNEERNIGYLLDDLKSQSLGNIVIDAIIVVSDGSTDRTKLVIQRSNYKLVKLIENSTRVGLALAQNQIIENCKSEVLVLLNADIRITDRHFLSRLCRPIIEGRCALTACRFMPITPNNFLEKVLFVSATLKQKISEEWNDGDNLLSCRGTARAFSRVLYKKLVFKSSFAEDAFSYIFCKSRNLNYCYVKDTFILYKLPDTLHDHLRQSLRFHQSQQVLKKYFKPTTLASHYRLPFVITVSALLSFLLRNPIHVLIYLLILLFIKIKSGQKVRTDHFWETSASSKLPNI